MEDIAHIASAPASPKPEEITPQQASRPDAPDRGKLRVFALSAASSWSANFKIN
jgi:hypothetical protein